MFRLFRQVSLREHRAHWGRALLVVAGIATGIGLIIAVDIINASVLAGFRQTFETLAGPADLEVTLGIGEVGFAEDVVDIVRRDRDVTLAVPFVRGTITLADDATESLQLFGAELTAEDDLARYGVRLASDRRAALAALTDPHAILVTAALAARRGLAPGSPLTLAMPRGVGTFTVRGLLAPDGLARVLGGQLVIMDLAAAQTQLVKEGRIDELDVVLRAGSDVAAARTRIEAALPATLTVGTPQARAQGYAGILLGLQITFTGLSMICVLAGLFIVYNATATGVVRRAPAIGALRLIGADARRLRRLLLAEAAALGTVGAISGVVLGIVLARLLVATLGNVMGTMMQLRFVVPELALDARRQALVGTLGIGVALCAAWIPAHQATRLEPLAVARGSTVDLPAAPRIAVLVLAWTVLTLLGVAGLAVGERWQLPALSIGGSTLWNAAGLVAGLVVVSALTGRLPRALARGFGIVGRIAGENVVRAPMRSGVTVAAIGLVTAIAVTLASVTSSYLATAAEYIAGVHDGDLAVSAVATEGGWLETPITPTIAGELAGIPGIRRIEAARVVPGESFRGGRIGLLALEPAAFMRLGAGLWRAGDRLEGRAAVAAGRAVAVSTIFSRRHGMGVGDRISLETPQGPLVLPIAGETADMSSNSGTVILSRRLYEEWWGDPTVSRLNVYLEPGVGVEDTRRRIAAQLGTRYRLKILALRENLAYHEDKIRHAFAFVNALQILIAIVTVAGIFDLLFSGILERRRELAVWRLIGAADRSVRRTVVVESVTLGALAGLVGLAVGIVASWIWVRLIIPHLIGYDLTYAFAALPTAESLALVVAMTGVAGWAAALRATRVSVLDGIRSE